MPDNTEEKRCTGCNMVKPINSFNKRSSKDYSRYKAWCKICENAYRRKRYNANPEKFRSQNKQKEERLKQNPVAYAHRKAKQKEYNKKNAGKYSFRNRDFQNASAQTVYLKLHDEQEGECAICKKAESARDQRGNVRSLALDHNHHTGQFRGLLCFRCNTVLSYLENDEFMNSASAYLAKHIERDQEP